ncbi:TetR/AcrR family transcriptional regulator C-terminal domain-containing protein [Streptomyces sp. NA02950]|uniref:TetR/AcrR family transcriptional regulator C-terminal domain-containing protein n=1 Tax=Streptomyces sp. NA02950 TaxID=2742137 RepID=UPI0020CB0AA3|nr:TetR/AcrR family transcriptional regulator C-terminal domain-containing protein [Streptomyces sp. NA02950]
MRRTLHRRAGHRTPAPRPGADGRCDARPLYGDPLPEPWEDRARALAGRYRSALLSHRDGARVVAGTHVAEDNTLRFADALTGAFLAGGHDPAEAAWRTRALVDFTLGLVQGEQAADGAGSPEPLRRAATPERYPAIAAAVPHFGGFEDRFGHGVGLIVGGRTREPDDRGFDHTRQPMTRADGGSGIPMSHETHQ